MFVGERMRKYSITCIKKTLNFVVSKDIWDKIASPDLALPRWNISVITPML
jgi:hypothetical protein